MPSARPTLHVGTSLWATPKMLRFIKIVATFIASLSPFVPLVHTARLIATSTLLVSPAGASAAEFNIHGSTRNHIAKVGNDVEQHDKRTRKASKQGKKGKSKTKQPPPTPPPQLRTENPTSEMARPTSAPTPTDSKASPGKIFMNISANFNISNINVVKGRRRQLAVTTTDLTTIMETTIQDVVRRSLNADQSLIAVNITEIDDSSINGSPISVIFTAIKL
jgi:hypothetical protein